MCTKSYCVGFKLLPPHGVPISGGWWKERRSWRGWKMSRLRMNARWTFVACPSAESSYRGIWTRVTLARSHTDVYSCVFVTEQMSDTLRTIVSTQTPEWVFCFANSQCQPPPIIDKSITHLVHAALCTA